MRSSWWSRLSHILNNFLDVGQPPEKADALFVFAGRQERKTYALELFRQGYASRLIFSVGRFEWRRFAQLGLADDGGLAELVQKTPAPQRHFFVSLDDRTAQCFLIATGKFGTLREAKALAESIQKQNFKNLIIVSSGFHLRRACAALRRYCSPRLQITPVAVPARFNAVAPLQSSLIFKEGCKYLLYKLLLPFYS